MWSERFESILFEAGANVLSKRPLSLAAKHHYQSAPQEARFGQVGSAQSVSIFLGCIEESSKPSRTSKATYVSRSSASSRSQHSWSKSEPNTNEVESDVIDAMSNVWRMQRNHCPRDRVPYPMLPTHTRCIDRLCRRTGLGQSTPHLGEELAPRAWRKIHVGDRVE